MNMKIVKSLVLLALLNVFITGCNTVAGAGEDVSAAGHAVTKAAKSAE
jgi:predicted small secreted protein